MQLSVDKDRCVATGQCIMTAPDVFDQDDEGLVELLDENPAPDQEGVVEAAARACPAQAILTGRA